jgi:hypothetical protein
MSRTVSFAVVLAGGAGAADQRVIGVEDDTILLVEKIDSDYYGRTVATVPSVHQTRRVQKGRRAGSTQSADRPSATEE